MKYHLIVFIFLIAACTSPVASDPLSDDMGLCEWFNKSLAIRTERIPGILIVQKVVEKYDGVECDFNNTAMIKDYQNALAEYISINDKFVDEWKKLGVHRLGRGYWENELMAIETVTEGYSLSLKGFNTRNERLIQQGADIYSTGSVASDKAEVLMIDLRAKCR